MATLHARTVQKALNDMAVRCKGRNYKVEDCAIIDALFGNQEPGS